jgi:hypothetical protein
LIPVLPAATSTDSVTFNVNADTFAGAIAGALRAKRLLLLTDVEGVLDKSKSLIRELSANDARRSPTAPFSSPRSTVLRAGRRRRRCRFSTAVCRMRCCSSATDHGGNADDAESMLMRR